jgi:hypothetical protein
MLQLISKSMQNIDNCLNLEIFDSINEQFDDKILVFIKRMRRSIDEVNESFITLDI